MFFNPVAVEFTPDKYQVNSVMRNIRIYNEQMPDLDHCHIALIGLPDSCGQESDATYYNAKAIREKLYNLKKGYGEYHIVDLGNLRSGIDLEDDLKRVSEVCSFLIHEKTIPLLIGGMQELAYGQYQAYQDMEKLISYLNVDAFLDMSDVNTDNHIEKIILHEPNYLFNYSHLAYQSYLIDSSMIETLEKLYFEAYRVGVIRTNIAEMEPIIREADMMSFDMCAIRSSDASGVNKSQPFGLTGEEACQICWYAGMNEKMSSVGFYEYNKSLDDEKSQTSSVLATMIWYFIEGFYHRKGDSEFDENDYMTYVVAMSGSPETIRFFKSKLSEKWWMEVPYPAGKSKYARNSIIPCSYSDYQEATNGNIPDRYINAHAKLI